jgi:hypothetical protein
MTIRVKQHAKYIEESFPPVLADDCRIDKNCWCAVTCDGVGEIPNFCYGNCKRLDRV